MCSKGSRSSLSTFRVYRPSALSLAKDHPELFEVAHEYEFAYFQKSNSARLSSGKSRESLTEKSELRRRAYGNWNHWSRRFRTSVCKTGVECRPQGKA